MVGPVGSIKRIFQSLDLSSLGVIINYLYMMQERIPIITQFFNMILTSFFFLSPLGITFCFDFIHKVKNKLKSYIF